ncbi:hypothetical protein [Amycolatopsis saalfeldensis]|uniref:Uncharacterized protein n=1 Tax=Amycolatopsis saalfeldensis TaxID=394193 RepID=A0A1H8SZJ3_9PSEU|nr:hypothetical protein [Amycolatopsis saalfeldensis]SEO83774.1 hypothetical protein SAMN04489732_102342 [Amycolatopsis saalfeldensis]
MSESTVPPDSGGPVADEAARPFGSYTAADHARVAMAEAAWSTLEAAFRSIVPEAHRPDGVPSTVLIEAASWARARAEDLLRAAVIASHERGLSWTQIGRGLGTSKQAAHERFAGDVTAFRKQLAVHLAALAEDPDAKPEKPEGFEHGWGLVPDTSFFAPHLDAWRAELGEIPGAFTPAGNPGELLAQLSDPATAVTGVNDTTARPVDVDAPRCRFTAESMSEDAEPGEYLVCLLPEGHPGKRHQLAVSNIYD